MTMIYRIRTIKPKAHRVFVAERLRALKASIAAQITDFGASTCMRLATWNLKHFGKGGRDSGHFRDVEPLLYIAEIISAFDLVAIQEVNENLDQLDELVSDYLGPEWDYVVTDTTEGTAGNHERLAFVYRMPKVRFEKVAGEIVLPRGQKIVGPEEENPDAEGDLQFARTPFVVAFQSGWLRFKICTGIFITAEPRRSTWSSAGGKLTGWPRPCRTARRRSRRATRRIDLAAGAMPTTS